MRIGIEATTLLNRVPGGIARYTGNLAEALIRLRAADSLIELAMLYPLSRFPRRARIRTQGIAPTRWYLGNLWPVGNQYDVIHCTDVRFVRRRSARSVYTVYDLAIFRKEHQFEHYTDPVFRDKILRRTRYAVEEADAIIAISQCTKNDLMEMFGVPEHKIFVTHLAPDMRATALDAAGERVLDRYKLRAKQYYLFVGAVSVRKNVLNLVRAFQRCKSAGGLHLVLAGPLSMGIEQIQEEIQRLGLAARIRLPGFVPDRDLPALLAGAAGMLYPTYYEGFGLPVLEGMQAMVPVLAGNRGAVPEIAAGYAVLVDPFDVDEIAAGIDALASVSQAQLTRARAYASTFTWDKVAEQTLAVYQG
jgi:glycosyltransferase involved in cell wall biosynthesis